MLLPARFTFSPLDVLMPESGYIYFFANNKIWRELQSTNILKSSGLARNYIDSFNVHSFPTLSINNSLECPLAAWELFMHLPIETVGHETGDW